MWQTLEAKARFIAQVMAPGCAIRSAEDVEVAALTYSEVKAIATGNVLFLRKAEIDSQVARLSLRKREHSNRKMRAKFELARADQVVANAKATHASLLADDLIRRQSAGQAGMMEINGRPVDDRDRFEAMIRQIKINASSLATDLLQRQVIGRFRGFDIVLAYIQNAQPSISLKGQTNHLIKEGESHYIAMRNAINRIEKSVADSELYVRELSERFASLALQATDEFADEAEYQRLCAEQQQIYQKLGLLSDQSYGASTEDNQTIEAEESEL
jgi:hypothetical protein